MDSGYLLAERGLRDNMTTAPLGPCNATQFLFGVTGCMGGKEKKVIAVIILVGVDGQEGHSDNKKQSWRATVLRRVDGRDSSWWS